MSSDFERVMRWFETGRLVRPRAAGRPTLLDMKHAIARTCGVEELPSSPQIELVCERIGKPEHLIFILVDGLGLELLQKLGTDDSFLKRHFVEEMEAVYPSTTTVALTALTTGVYPCEHGFPGWWVFFEKLGVTAELLPFHERFTKKPLQQFGAVSNDILCVPNIFPRFKRVPQIVTLKDYVHSTYSTYWATGGMSYGYERISHGCEIVLGRVEQAKGPSYHHLYVPQLDSTCHKHGIDHPEVLRVFEIIDAELKRLHKNLDGRARMVISADHGHVNREVDRHLKPDDKLMETLRCPPSGEPTVPVFHVKPGRHEEFRALFAEQFGEFFALLTLDEVERLKMLGPGPLSERARTFFGDYIGVTPAPNTIHFYHPQYPPSVHRGVHAGLTPGEMRIPLIIA
ncbi:MAG TPA: alkaline phosphatase family protein [Planctomycetota bacterium]|nr:alkaline phosphatase family protein [Planctomycetota bacterium]